jgi:hypothetical protein
MSQTAPCSKSTAPPRSDKLCRPPATHGDRRNVEAWWPTTHRCRDVPRRLRSGGRAEYASCSRADVAGRGPLWSATPSCGAVDRARAPHIPALAQGGGVAAGAAAGNATSAHALALPRRLRLTRGSRVRRLKTTEPAPTTRTHGRKSTRGIASAAFQFRVSRPCARSHTPPHASAGTVRCRDLPRR